MIKQFYIDGNDFYVLDEEGNLYVQHRSTMDQEFKKMEIKLPEPEKKKVSAHTKH